MTFVNMASETEIRKPRGYTRNAESESREIQPPKEDKGK